MKTNFITKTVGLTLFSCLCLLSTTIKAQTEYTVYIGNSGFNPNNLTVEVGDYVHFMLDVTNNSGAHYSTSTNIPIGATSWNYVLTCSTCKYTVVCSEPGVYQYTDSNSGMNGTFTVNAPASQGVIEATITNLNATGSFAYYPGNVTNTDVDSPVEVNMTFNNIYMPAGWIITMCNPNGCFVDGITSSTFTINANLSASIQVDIFSNGVTGVGSVLVRFENTADNTDFAEILVQLENTGAPTGISESTGGVTLLKNYPNPFKYNTTIAYGINSNEGEIQITDGLGRTIAKYPINNSSGEIIVKEALNSGVYFYSLWDGRKLVKRKKMQVLR